MAMIERKEYLDQLIQCIGTPSIKLINGIKGSGKSVILNELKNYITQEIPDAHIIYISFEFLKYEKLRNWKALKAYIENEYQEGKHNFVFVDDVQLCPTFERAINDLYATNKYDIFLAAPHSFGKHFKINQRVKLVDDVKMIEIFPASLKEFMTYYELDNAYEAYERYAREGGMLGSYALQSLKAKYAFSMNILDQIIGTEILPTYSLYLPENIYPLCDYLRKRLGATIVPRQLATEAAFIQDRYKEAGAVPIYINYMCEAHMFHKIGRYRIDQNTPLSKKQCYAWTDSSFYCAKVDEKDWNKLKLCENIVLIELLRRGYEVYKGYFYKKETKKHIQLGCVAVKDNQRYYIDVLESVNDQEKMEQLIADYQYIKEDECPKFIVTLDKCEAYEDRGIKIMNVADWLVGNE